MDLHSERPLVAFLGLVHLRIPRPFFVFGGAGRRDQSGIDDRALPNRHAPLAEVGFDGLKDLLTQLVLLQQVTATWPWASVAEPLGEDRGLIRDPLTDQIDTSKAAHAGHIDQCLLHRRVAERIPLLQQMDSQHRGQWIGWPATFLAFLGVVGLDQIDQCLPGHHRLHLSENLLPLGLLLGRGQLVVRKTERVAADHLSPDLRSQHHSRGEWRGFPEAP